MYNIKDAAAGQLSPAGPLSAAAAGRRPGAVPPASPTTRNTFSMYVTDLSSDEEVGGKDLVVLLQTC
jgi:hypothetical protein